MSGFELNCRQNTIFIQQEVNYNTELKLIQNYSCNPTLEVQVFTIKLKCYVHNEGQNIVLV